ncbi:transposase [Rhodobacter sp. ETT8]|uniref:Transposase n=1 Tax=Pseudotabrizicola algicola TaxID=2709381 RepID=A0A6B3RNF5_9RHOB|nr:transposase [Pseudotabrizicola algicola]
MAAAPQKEWWSTAELSAAALPDLPDTRQGVDDFARRNDWRGHPEFARRRSGRGGGWEYSWRLLPPRAQRRLIEAAAADAGDPTAPERMDREEAWAWYEGLKENAKARALTRLRIIQQVEAMEPVLGRDLAVRQVAMATGQGARTIWNWLNMIEGVRSADRLPYLVDRRNDGASRQGGTVDCDPEFFDLIKSYYLRLSGPSFASAYRAVVRIAKARGLAILPEWMMRRRLNAVVSHVTQVLLRKGLDAVKRLYPSQVRDKTCLHALEAVNADYHKWDNFVIWPVEPGQNEPPYIGRPQMVAFQDIFSGRIIAWRVDQTANSSTVLLAAGDMIEDWGIPKHVLLDNGREFAAKSVTGGSETRYRFKVMDDDVPGLFTSLGCEIHWATPYSGQSKPIERAFRDMCDSIAKDPRLEGSWTGNRPDAKPENYGSRAIELEEFLRIVAEGIAEHNTRVGRRSEVAYGRSFAEAFDESYARSKITKATEAQRRMWMMGAKGLKTHSRTGEVSLMGNKYWSSWMTELAGRAVVVRFDPADLWAGLHIYSQDNAYLGHAETFHRGGFFAMEDAKVLAKSKRAWLKAEREAAKAHKVFTAAELGRELDKVAPVEPGAPAASVVQLVPTKAVVRGKPKVAPQADAPGATVTTLPSRPRRAVDPVQSPRELFRRALELEQIIEAGGPVTADQQRWLTGFQTTSDYRTERKLWLTHGDTLFG